jgi:hypothetical protein
MIPFQDRRIKMVQVFHSSYIHGFRFLDSKLQTIFEVGILSVVSTNIVLEDNEQIVGISAKTYSSSRTLWTDFRFIVCTLI